MRGCAIGMPPCGRVAALRGNRSGGKPLHPASPHPRIPALRIPHPASRARFHAMAPIDEQSTYFRKGFGLKADVQGDLSADYNGRIVDALRENDYALAVEDVTIRLAREFGFCYGVERAVEHAYQTRRKFPDRRLLLV